MTDIKILTWTRELQNYERTYLLKLLETTFLAPETTNRLGTRLESRQ